MKILLVNKFHYLCGGSERYFFGLRDLLTAKGHTVIPFAMKDPRNRPTPYDRYFAEPVDVKKFSWRDIFKTFYNYDAVKKLCALIEAERPDIAHLHNIGNHLSPAVISVLKKHRIPVIQTLHDYKLVCPNRQLFNRGKVCERCRGGRYYQCFVNKCIQNSRAKSLLGAAEAYLTGWLKTYEQVDLFIAPSRFLKETMVSFGVPPYKIATINNFIDNQESFQNVNLKNTSPYILYFGRLTEEKGIVSVLQAMREVKPGIKLFIAGDGPEITKTGEMIKLWNLTGRVKILGARYGGELAALIAGAKAIVIPSIWRENMPYSLLEAMAQGKTVIASRSGGMTEIIRDGETGMLFDPGDYRGLADKINRLTDIDSSYLGQKARTAVSRLNPENHYRELLKLYGFLTKNAKTILYDKKNSRQNIAIQPTA